MFEQVPGTTSTTQYIANIAKVRSKGVELDLAFAPTTWLSFTASGAYTDARFVSYANAPQRPELAIPGTLQIQNLSGQRLPAVPEFAYSLGLDLNHAIDPAIEIYGHADFQHRSSFNSNAANSIYGIIPAYGLLNARIGLRTGDGKYDFSFRARNLTEKLLPVAFSRHLWPDQCIRRPGHSVPRSGPSGDALVYFAQSQLSGAARRCWCRDAP